MDTRFRHGPDRRITVISAGTLCGGAAFRHGRAYNIVEIDVKNRAGRLHLREMQNDNLRMPIWGARSLPPNHTSYFDFAFEAPPEPFAEPDGTTIMLGKAQAAYDSGDYRAAADSFSPLVSSDPLARRLYLESLIRLNDHPTLIASYDPPQSTVEAIALMDALWAQGEREQLAQVLKLEVIAASSDPSVSEIRKKYMVRLRK